MEVAETHKKQKTLEFTKYVRGINLRYNWGYKVRDADLRYEHREGQKYKVRWKPQVYIYIFMWPYGLTWAYIDICAHVFS